MDSRSTFPWNASQRSACWCGRASCLSRRPHAEGEQLISMMCPDGTLPGLRSFQAQSGLSYFRNNVTHAIMSTHPSDPIDGDHIILRGPVAPLGTTSTREIGASRITSLDALRTIMCFGIALYHYVPYFFEAASPINYYSRYCAYFTDLFFVLSGLFMAKAASRTWSRSSYREFIVTGWRGYIPSI